MPDSIGAFNNRKHAKNSLATKFLTLCLLFHYRVRHSETNFRFFYVELIMQPKISNDQKLSFVSISNTYPIKCVSMYFDGTNRTCVTYSFNVDTKRLNVRTAQLSDFDSKQNKWKTFISETSEWLDRASKKFEAIIKDAESRVRENKMSPSRNNSGFMAHFYAD